MCSIVEKHYKSDECEFITLKIKDDDRTRALVFKDGKVKRNYKPASLLEKATEVESISEDNLKLYSDMLEKKYSNMSILVIHSNISNDKLRIKNFINSYSVKTLEAMTKRDITWREIGSYYSEIVLYNRSGDVRQRIFKLGNLSFSFKKDTCKIYWVNKDKYRRDDIEKYVCSVVKTLIDEDYSKDKTYKKDFKIDDIRCKISDIFKH